MDFTYAVESSTGPIRQNNEDNHGWFLPETLEEKRARGAVVLLADGMGGHGNGEKASQLAITQAMETFKKAKAGSPTTQILEKMFTAANIAVYDAGMQDRSEGRMATTLTACLFRHNEVTIGHVGDCRVYLVRQGRIQRLTTDHSYVGMQLKMGLISEREAMTSELRSMLTRSIGQNMTVGPDVQSVVLYKGDCLVQCSDGLHGWVTEAEIGEAVLLYPPAEACRYLLGMAEKRKTDDNISVQVVRIEAVEQVGYYRGLPYYVAPEELPAKHEVQSGQTLDERFQILDPLARSATATIFKATDLSTQTTVALKIPFEQHQDDPDLASLLNREEQIGMSMSHPNIMRVYPFEKKSRPYLIMEYLEGQTLANKLLTIKKFPISEALKVASCICGALDYMHRRRMNIVHRDLKPENIMLCTDGTIKLMDFGIAKATGSRSITFAGYVPAVGTPDYLAPEQVRGERGDERTDIYSLGVILYEMLTGVTPFDGPNAYAVMNARLAGDPQAPRELNPEIPLAVEELVLHALERDPAQRFKSAAEMKQDLDEPDLVELVGRYKKLKPARAARSRGTMFRFTLLLLLLPIILIVLFFLFFHK